MFSFREEFSNIFRTDSKIFSSLFRFSERQNQMGDASLSNVEDTINVKCTLADASDRQPVESSAADVESFIPTAIVKPKYQKLSFDERQLPVCGSTDDHSWQSPTNTTTTITSTPRKVQKHLPKTQKSFAKQTRKLAAKSGEFTVEQDVSDKEAISSRRLSEKDIDCSVAQNSIAIVQPLKKTVVDVNASVSMNDGMKSFDRSKNSLAISNQKFEQNSRNSSKIVAANEIASIMSASGGNNNLSGATRKVASVVRDSERKVPVSKKKELRDQSGKKSQTAGHARFISCCWQCRCG